MMPRLGKREKLKLGTAIAKSFGRGSKDYLKGKESVDISPCWGDMSDPVQVKQRDPTHCFYEQATGRRGAGVLFGGNFTSTLLIISSVFFALGGLIAGGVGLYQKRTPLMVLGLLLFATGLVLGVIGIMRRGQVAPSLERPLP
jgi:hypothetical protein